MSQSDIEPKQQAAALERNLRTFKRNIIGTAVAGRTAVDDNTKVPLFQARYEAALRDWDSFCAVWKELDIICDTICAGKFPTTQLQEMYDTVRDEILQARAYLITIEKGQQTSQPAVNYQHDSSMNASFNASFSNRVNLPKISIPHFSGDLTQWSHFKDVFLSLVHNDPSLSNVEKFHYLLSAVKGEAMSLLSHHSVEAGTYHIAWQTMLSVYDIPRVLGRVFIHKLLDCNLHGIKGERQRYQAFLSEVADSIQAFNGLKLEKPAEFILSTLALRALDSATRKQFELNLDPQVAFPSPDDVIDFVRKRLTALKMAGDSPLESRNTSDEPLQPHGNSRRPPNRNSKRYNSVALYGASTSTSSHALRPRKPSPPEGRTRMKTELSTGPWKPSTETKKRDCPFCHAQHWLPFCASFADMPCEKRFAFVTAWKGCSNCLREGHKARECPSKWSCRYCKQRHHSLLHHLESVPKRRDGTRSPVADVEGPLGFTGFGSAVKETRSEGMVLLGTIQGLIRTQKGSYHVFRALLDSGSQHTFITSSLAKRIGATVRKFEGRITGLGGTAFDSIKGSTRCVLKSFGDNQSFDTQCLLVDRICSSLPNSQLTETTVDAVLRHPVADVEFGHPGHIDLLIGSDLYPRIISGAPVHSGIEGLFFLPSVFGLVVIGQTNISCGPDEFALFSQQESNIETHMKAFWEMEEPAPVTRNDPEDEFCETHFSATHSRTPEGRYVVRLPFKNETPSIGDNRDTASKRFSSLERKFVKHEAFASAYRDFMVEYEALGHMSYSEIPSRYVIPHHGVWQYSSERAKLRVVFDASCPSSTCSLNDLLLSGPKLQTDICQVLINFRMFHIPLCADIVKMYRQILVHTEDRRFQHIFWRSSRDQKVIEYQLNTVTYGLKPSAFLAMRAVKQLVLDEGQQFPLAVDRVTSSMYVDDLVTGADTLEEALALKEQLSAFFSKGGFELGKWASTLPELVSDSVRTVNINGNEPEYFKILGMRWSTNEDAFFYDVSLFTPSTVTKRSMLSTIARIFDPLGLLAPVTLLAKTFVQEIWKLRLGWDNSPPADVVTGWQAWLRDLPRLSELRIPRYITHREASIRIIGFCDASGKGYSAAVYLRSSKNGRVNCSLIKAKTKVAPLKYMSVARLELCSALLLARVIESLNKSLLKDPAICFSDSAVVLAWLRMPTYKLSVFEANRVSAILEAMPGTSWRHVDSEDNPADLASRGCLASAILETDLWWNGPQWLLQDMSSWPTSIQNCEIPPVALLAHSAVDHKDSAKPDVEWMDRFSSWRALLHVSARLMRWVARFKQKPVSPFVSAEEVQMAKIRCVRLAQRKYLPNGLFSNAADLPKDLRSLQPFVDGLGIVRVGGRLHNSTAELAMKHPMLVPRQSHIAKLIVDETHARAFHAGPTLTLALTRQEFWIPGGLRFVKNRTSRCVLCRMKRARPNHTLMGALPADRLKSGRVFAQVGVDYAGPFTIKEPNRRKANSSKAYLCLFVCTSTKALHLKTTSSLTTAAFLAALDRFTARRGRPDTIWSDHGTNFTGASRFLKDLFSFLVGEEAKIGGALASQGITWKFIPPRAPHFGGLWEAGVKSVKRLLTSTLGTKPMTFEELNTVFVQIEGLLNSRPLCALTEDVENFQFLTPGHFLVGSSVVVLPDAHDPSMEGSLLRHWRAVQASVKTVWCRWQRDYLHTLQQRHRWFTRIPDLKKGELVILLEKRPLLGKWPVGRVAETHPGRDGVTRVASIRIPSGKVVVRAASSLVPLFHPEASEDSMKNSTKLQGLSKSCTTKTPE